MSVSEKSRSIFYYSGGLALLFLLLQIISGALLSIYYAPTADVAFKSIQYINGQVSFGAFFRSIHYWSGHTLILSAIVCLCSGYFYRVYRKPNEFKWIVSMAAFLILLLFAFTGQSLPWTQLSYFGTAIGISQIEKIPVAGTYLAGILRGGVRIGNETLGRMFSIHSIILPACLIVILLITFMSKRTDRNKRITDAGAVYPFKKFDANKVLIIALTGLAIISLLAVLVPKGLGQSYDINNPSEAPLRIHPEWYFMWIYQTLKADSFMPGILILAFLKIFILLWIIIPYIDSRLSAGKNRTVINAFGIISISYIIGMTVWGYAESGISAFEISSASGVATGGIDKASFLGIILFTVVIMIFLLYLRTRSMESRSAK